MLRRTDREVSAYTLHTVHEGKGTHDSVQHGTMREVGVFGMQEHRREERRSVQHPRATGIAPKEDVDTAMGQKLIRA